MISRENNFDLIRLLAAFQVLLGHAFWHLEIGGYSNLVVNYFPGVLIFFTISGFLITFSFDRNHDIKKYFVNRLLRIYPALWSCIIVTIILLFVFGVLNGSNYYQGNIIKWFIAQITFGQFYTPDVLRTWGVGCPNGSLWTIPAELQFYILLPMIILAIKKLNLSYKLLIIGMLSIGINSFLGSEKVSLVEKVLQCSCLPYLYCFFIGSILYVNWEKIQGWIRGKFLLWLLVYCTYCLLLQTGPSYHPSVITSFGANILLGILTISAAFTFPKLGKILKGYDISYGMYIYHMLVINTMVQLGYTGRFSYFWIVVFVTILLSFLSWIFVEKKALTLKNKF